MNVKTMLRSHIKMMIAIHETINYINELMLSILIVRLFLVVKLVSYCVEGVEAASP